MTELFQVLVNYIQVSTLLPVSFESDFRFSFPNNSRFNSAHPFYFDIREISTLAGISLL